MNFDEPLDDSLEPIEAYCVHCRETVEMDDPVAVWTRRGVPATRGDCPICGGTVFRMGKSAVHERVSTPEAHPRIRLARETVYVDFAPADAVIAERLAADLERIGVNCWMHEQEAPGFNWASGVHPALSGCDRMIYVLSAERCTCAGRAGMALFPREAQAVIVAQVDASAPPGRPAPPSALRPFHAVQSRLPAACASPTGANSK
ncbi:MAG: DUF5679 domain-containing protein [Anaerolineae bacterium]